MLQPRCLRCGRPFEPREPRQRDCTTCIGEVTKLIEQDAARRTRFPHAKALDWSAR